MTSQSVSGRSFVPLGSPAALRAAPRPTSLSAWTSDAVVRLLTLNGLALATLLICWYQASGEVTAHDQLVWMNVGLAGLGISGLANAAWLLRGRQAVGAARAAWLPDGATLQPGRAPTVASPMRETTTDDSFVVGRQMSRYHRSTCQLAAGRQLWAAPRADLELDGFLPCEVCRP
jgi:hypothetical protein